MYIAIYISSHLTVTPFGGVAYVDTDTNTNNLKNVVISTDLLVGFPGPIIL